jgi:hypothetical protein
MHDLSIYETVGNFPLPDDCSNSQKHYSSFEWAVCMVP